MNISHFQLRHNGIDFMVECMPVASRVDAPKPLMRCDMPFGRPMFEMDTGEKRCGIYRVAYFNKPKDARAAICEAYGYNAEIRDPEYR